MSEGTILLQDCTTGAACRWLRFRAPRRVLSTGERGCVRAVLGEVAAAVAKDRVYAAGFVAYEAAPAFDAALTVRDGARLPLIWFGLYDEPEEIPAPSAPVVSLPCAAAWVPSIEREAYAAKIAAIRSYLRAGDSYQVNYTIRLRTAFDGDPSTLFATLCRAQPTSTAAYVDIGEHVICSASPELFFSLRGTRLWSRPMKGTARRGLTAAQDKARMAALAASEKNRAENVMIVDMVRNDMGRVAAPGTVRVERMFEVERYPTVLQMTSTVACRTTAPLVELFGALFPCASITGAPKVRTMQIIAELESCPREIYTGSIGFIAPDRTAQFNVAIRTVQIDRKAGCAAYGVGGGIVWDSVAMDEYSECVAKAAMLSTQPPPSELLETILWQPGAGFALLDRHLARLAASAEYFQYPLDPVAVRDRLERAAAAFAADARKVRLLLDRTGRVRVEDGPVPPVSNDAPVRLGLAREPVDPADPFLYHKTTQRRVYQAARASRPDCDEVLLWNRRGEITEASIANVVVEMAGRSWTPPVACGLLPGTYRDWLVAQGQVQERAIRIDTLAGAERIWLVNAVRGKYAADLSLAFLPRL